MPQDHRGDRRKWPKKEQDSAHHAGRGLSALLLRSAPGGLREAGRRNIQIGPAERASCDKVSQIISAIGTLLHDTTSSFKLKRRALFDFILSKFDSLAAIHIHCVCLF